MIGSFFYFHFEEKQFSLLMKAFDVQRHRRHLRLGPRIGSLRDQSQSVEEAHFEEETSPLEVSHQS